VGQPIGFVGSRHPVRALRQRPAAGGGCRTSPEGWLRWLGPTSTVALAPTTPHTADQLRIAETRTKASGERSKEA
jgi:hypothetical protein